ncbi:hypothetical protein, partial [Nocardia abscessus]|uniref:hypothetical protein n=1 Tax=Nocardia abscessus TaxID=120957 RepID=UPI001C3F2A5C
RTGRAPGERGQAAQGAVVVQDPARGPVAGQPGTAAGPGAARGRDAAAAPAAAAASVARRAVVAACADPGAAAVRAQDD